MDDISEADRRVLSKLAGGAEQASKKSAAETVMGFFDELSSKRTPEQRETDANRRAAEARASAKERKVLKALAVRLGRGWHRGGRELDLDLNFPLRSLYRTYLDAKGRRQERISNRPRLSPFSQAAMPDPPPPPTGPPWQLDQLKAEVLRVVREIHEGRMLKDRPHSPNGVSAGEVWIALLALPVKERPPGKTGAIWKRVREALDSLGNAEEIESNEATGDKRYVLPAKNTGTILTKAPKRGKPVILGKPGESVLVLGKKKPPLTDAQFSVVRALLKAGRAGLSLKALIENSGRGGAWKVLKGLTLDQEWAQVIVFSGKPGVPYRISWPSESSG